MGAAGVLDGGCVMVEAQIKAMRNYSVSPHNRKLYSEELCLGGQKGTVLYFLKAFPFLAPTDSIAGRSWRNEGVALIYRTYRWEDMATVHR